jgi:RNA polymerase sigma factor (sigma-70 family)
MAHVATGSVVRQIGSLFEGGSVSGLSDRQLLDRFGARRDAAGEAAFAAIVARHGPMVLHVCRQLLGDYQHAEDTFQAVFLVLARRAPSIRDPDLLSHWLYGVTVRAARKAKVRMARQHKNERNHALRGASPESGVPADRSAIEREQAELLHDEIERLPRDFQLPIVLCYFEGLPLDEAARRLQWREGTLRSRLARARDKLRRGLTRRGIVLPAVALAAVLDTRVGSAAISSPLRDLTTRAALDFADKPAAVGTASALAKELLRSMLVHKLKLTALTLLFIGAIASGTASVALAPARQATKPEARHVAAQPDELNRKPGAGQMFVTGRVLDPHGKPVPNASVMVYARSAVLQMRDRMGQLYPKELGRAATDGSGRFRADVPRTSSSRHDQFGAVALAPGFGAGWVDALDPDADQPTADITLLPERVIHGRLFDVQGQPARGVKLSVTAIRRVLPDAPNRRQDNFRQDNFEGPAFWWAHPDDLPGWPGPAITGADGRFTLHGVGPGLRAFLSVVDPRFTNQLIEITTDATSTSPPLSFALQPARLITGRVTYADTGKPVPNAEVHVAGFDQFQPGVGARPIMIAADADGRFYANPGSGADGFVSAYAPNGQPYLPIARRIDWPKGALRLLADLALPRGSTVSGNVTEQGSGRPVSGAVVSFFHDRTTNDEVSIRQSRPVETAADGSFALSVAAKPGYLLVRAPTDDYVLKELDRGLLLNGQPSNQRVYVHAFHAWDPKVAGASRDVELALRPSITVNGRVVAPDGQPVPAAWVLSRTHLSLRSPLYRMWTGDQHGTARNGQFELHGLDPDSEVAVSFLEPKRKLGATVRFSAKSAVGAPIVVKLEPCATATARLVGPDGKPVGGFTPRGSISMVVTPGEFSTITAQKDGTLFADQDFLTVIDPINYQNDPASDAQGRIVFPALIPGATYRIIDRTTIRTPTGPQLRKEFTVKPGELLDLGNIAIEKPQR